MEKILGVPYLSQLDNKLNPYGSCNVSSVAMVLTYFKFQCPVKGQQLEDYLYQYCQTNNLSRHSPTDLAELFNRMAERQQIYYRNKITTAASIEDIKRQIDNGFPVIVHGYFTGSGHIIVVRGYDDKAYEGRGALIVNDPYGEWFKSGYNTSNSGEALKYSYQMIERCCAIEGTKSIWAHMIKKIER